ncbi:MAG TPA: DUF177 domain-containing protein [Longimicrobiales bacterium]|nr:DUF177 domain-containing protein [Longimicrobiales bacterium]
MLTLDLGRLQRSGGHDVRAVLEPDTLDWDGAEARSAGPLEVHLSVRPAGNDVIARGTVEGSVEGPCRRCLEPAASSVREPLSLVFRRDADEGDPDAYPLPARGASLDLWPAVREQWLLAVPAFLQCRNDCRGLCPRCGANLNDEDCGCIADTSDTRWGPLLALAGGAATDTNDEVADGRSEEEGIEAEKA